MNKILLNLKLKHKVIDGKGTAIDFHVSDACQERTFSSPVTNSVS